MRPVVVVLRKPEITDKEFEPNFNFFEKYFFKSLKQKKQERYAQLYNEALERWTVGKTSIEQTNERHRKAYELELQQYHKMLEEIRLNNQQEVIEWENRKEQYYQEQTTYNQKIDKLKEGYFSKHHLSIIENCEIVLNNSKYPDYFPKTFELDYDSKAENLIVDYCLPHIDVFPRVKHVKFIKASEDFKETYIPQTQVKAVYTNAILQIAIRTIHELFEADVVNAIKTVCFNGYVELETKKYIISYQADKETFVKLKLKDIDCGETIRNFKGIFKNNFSEILPVMTIDKKSKAISTA